MTIITGDVGVFPGTAITGFPPGVVIAGTIHAGDTVAATAHGDAGIAYATLKGMPCLPANNLSGQILGTAVLSLPPGTYCFNSSAQLTGTLSLTGGGPWIFQIGSTLTTASNSHVMVDVPANCSGSNVFWQVGSSATLGTNTEFVGSILANTSITLNAGVNVDGSAIALTGAVTMDRNQVSPCSGASGVLLPPVLGKCEAPKNADNDHDKDKDHKDKDHKDNDRNDKDHESKDR